MTQAASERVLVSVEEVRAVTPIEDADSIEQVTVRGWTVVTRIGEFHEGDRCVYFEIDSALPLADERFAFLGPRGRKVIHPDTDAAAEVHVLKTARFRGVYSQGLVMPLANFPEAETATAGTDLAALLGVEKYEPPIPVELAGVVVGAFPQSLGQTTDSERVQNLEALWPALLEAGPWEATEKVDGTSCSVFRDTDGALHVCGRNWEIAAGTSIHWQMVEKFGLGDLLEPGAGVQLEIYGPGIQKNPLGVADVRIGVFDYTVNRVPQQRAAWPAGIAKHAVPVLPLVFPSTAAEAVGQVEGLQSHVAPGRQAEGVVWHTVTGNRVRALGWRSTFKAINNRYLLKHDA